MTSTGLLLIPLGLLLLLAPWRWSLLLMPTFCLLHAAAVVQIGSFGLQPGYFLGLLMVGRTLAGLTLGGQPFNRRVLQAMGPLFVLLVSAVATLWLALYFFQGEVEVIGGSAGFNLDRAAPFSFQRENITQLSYLLINLLIVYAVAHQLARLPREEIPALAGQAMALALLIASGLCLWHYASSQTGLPWPDSFFQSNTSYRAAHGQRMLGELRVNGPFSEPSALSYFYCGFLLFAWFRFRERPTMLSAALILLCLVCLFLAKATTGFFAMAVFAAVAGGDMVLSVLRGRIRLPRISVGSVLGVIIMLGGLAAGAAYLAAHQEFVGDLIEKVVVQKQESSSYEERAAVNLMAISIAMETYGIGLGLGSHKPSSLPLTLLCNVGVVGTAAYLLFMLDLLRPRRGHGPAPDGLSLRPLKWHLLGLLLIHAFSNPNLSMVMVWLDCGLLCGALAARPGTAVLAQPAWPLRRRRLALTAPPPAPSDAARPFPAL